MTRGIEQSPNHRSRPRRQVPSAAAITRLRTGSSRLAVELLLGGGALRDLAALRFGDIDCTEHRRRRRAASVAVLVARFDDAAADASPITEESPA